MEVEIPSLIPFLFVFFFPNRTLRSFVSLKHMVCWISIFDSAASFTTHVRLWKIEQCYVSPWCELPKNVLEAGVNINHVTAEGFGEGRSDGLGHGMSENIIKRCQNTHREGNGWKVIDRTDITPERSRADRRSFCSDNSDETNFYGGQGATFGICCTKTLSQHQR